MIMNAPMKVPCQNALMPSRPRAVADHLDQRRPDQGAERRADTAGEIGAADDRRARSPAVPCPSRDWW